MKAKTKIVNSLWQYRWFLTSKLMNQACKKKEGKKNDNKDSFS